MKTDNQPTKRKTAPPWTENAVSHNNSLVYATKTFKWKTTLTHLLRGKRHRFQAEHWGDHALHSTVSSLQRNHGLSFNREWCEVPTRFGKPCRVISYWVADASRNQALRLIARQKRRGGA